MEPLDDLDPLAFVFPDGAATASASAAGGSAAAPMRARPAPTVDFPLDPMLGPVFRAFERAGVRWSLLGLPKGGRGREEVSILVDRGAMVDAGVILATHGFAPLPAWGSSPRFVGYNAETDVWVVLAVVGRLAYGYPLEFETEAEQGCLERRRWDGGLYMLAPDDEFWSLLIGVLFDDSGREADARVLARLERLTIEARVDSPLARLVAGILPAPWTPVHLVDCVWEADWETLLCLVPHLQEAWAAAAGGPGAKRRRWANRVLYRIAERQLFPPRPGMTVALLAPDAGAKAALANALGRTFFLPVTYMRMGAPPRRRRGGRLARAGFFATLWAQAQRWGLGRLRKGWGRLVIFDRYSYDWRLPAGRSLSLVGRAKRAVLGRSVPGPDLVVALDLPGRGQGVRERYAELGARLPVPVLTVECRPGDSGVAGADRLRRDVTAGIWRAYAAQPTPAWLRPLQAVAVRLSRA